MNDFSRKNQLFSLCGLNCGLCPMQLGGYCPGCGGGPGNQPCAIARCSLRHDRIEYCFLCPEFPCPRYQGIGEYDSFITHRHQLEDMARAREIGIEAYNLEQARKAEILQALLSDFNDGRRKTFYCLAVNLLPLEDLENAMEQAAGRADCSTIKEKAGLVVSIMNHFAICRGLVLKLRKK